MKLLFLSVCTFLFLATTNAAPLKYTLTQSTSNWTDPSKWSPAGVPQNGDTILLPVGKILTFNDDVSLSNVYIDIFGRLELSGLSMKATFTGTSTINLEAGAILYGSKASQQIIMNNIIFKGNAVPLVGPKIATTLSNGFISYVGTSTLPVKFMTFTVTSTTNSYLLKWTTAEEQNIAYFDVQRSNDGTSWKSIATVFTTGESNSEYHFTDKGGNAGTVQFRIKEVDQNGSYTYSIVRMLRIPATSSAIITALQNKITIAMPPQVKGNVRIDVIGLNGFIYTTKTSSAAATMHVYTALKGFYIVRVSDGQNLNVAKTIIL